MNKQELLFYRKDSSISSDLLPYIEWYEHTDKSDESLNIIFTRSLSDDYLRIATAENCSSYLRLYCPEYNDIYWYYGIIIIWTSTGSGSIVDTSMSDNWFSFTEIDVATVPKWQSEAISYYKSNNIDGLTINWTDPLDPVYTITQNNTTSSNISFITSASSTMNTISNAVLSAALNDFNWGILQLQNIQTQMIFFIESDGSPIYVSYPNNTDQNTEFGVLVFPLLTDNNPFNLQI